MTLYTRPNTIIPGLKATSTLAAKQYYIVKLSSTAGEVKVCAAATDQAIGVAYNDAAAGEVVEVAVGGVLKMACEATVTAGDWVAPSTTGRAKTTTTANDNVVGIALQTYSTAGGYIPVLWTTFNY